MTTSLALNGNHPTTDTDPEFELTHTGTGDDEEAFDEVEFDDDDEHQQPAAALDDDEDEAFAPSMDLARLTGYDTTAEVEALPPSVLPGDDSEEAPVGSALSLDSGDEDDDEDVIDPRAVKTKHGIIGSPFTKLAVVGAGTLVVMVALGLFLSSVMGGKDAKTPLASATPTPSPTTEAVSPQSDEVALYKTQSALTRQNELLNGATPPKPLPTTKPTAPTAPAPIPLASPMPMPVAPAMTMLSAPTALPTAAPVDPMEQWRMAATIGSYGQVSSGNAGGSSSSAPSNATVPVAPAYVPPVVPSNTPAGSRPLSQLRASSSVPGLRDRPLSSVLVGTTATGQTTTAVVMTGDNTTPIAPDSPSAIKYLAKLSSGLNDASGNVALPAGSQVVMVARSFSPQTGLAEFVVTSVIVDNKEYTVPKDTLVVRGTNGGLVAFSKRSTGSGGLFTSLLPAFFAGVSQAGQVLNQPTSSSSVSGGNVSATTSSSNPSPVAGFAQGFSQNLATALQQKTQAANQAAASAPVSWQLGAGAEVKVFVNSSFEM